MIKQVHSLIGNVKDPDVLKALEMIARLAITNDEMKVYVKSQIPTVDTLAESFIAKGFDIGGGEDVGEFNP